MVADRTLLGRSEVELIRDARRGDGAAFAELLRPEYENAVRLACGLLHDADEAEDAVQEAALTAWKRLNNLHDGASLRPWFLGIVANRCRTVQRGRWWSVIRFERTVVEASAGDIAEAVDLRRALLRLHQDERLVLVLRYYLDLSYEEVAATMAITPSAARKRVERAMNRLRPLVSVHGATV